MSIDEGKRYQFVTEQLRYHNEKIIEAFSLFIKLVSAIIGGIALVSMQDLNEHVRDDIINLSPYLVILIGLSCLLLIYFNLTAWWGYRKAESKLIGSATIKQPKFPKSCRSEILMFLIILLVCIMFAIIVWRWDMFSGESPIQENGEAILNQMLRS